MFFDVLKNTLEIFLLNPPPLSVIPIRYQFYFRKHKISTEYQISMLFDLLRRTFEIFYYNPPPFILLIRHQFYFRKHRISIKKNYVIRRKKKYFRNILKQFSPISHRFDTNFTFENIEFR